MIMQSYDVDRRFTSVGRVYGEDRLEIFKKSHICIVGIGGVGSWVAESLARPVSYTHLTLPTKA